MDRTTRCVLDWLAHLVDPELRPRPLLAPDAAGLQLAYENGMAGLLYRVLRDDGAFDDLPPLLRQRLKDTRNREVAMDLQSEAAAQRLGEAFRAADIPAIALKGLALRSVLYAPRRWNRGPADIDLLVPRELLTRAEEVMDEAGFVRLGKYPAHFYRNHHHVEPRTMPNRPGILVDVHWTIARAPHPFQIDLEGIWRRAVPLEGGGELFDRLDDLDQVLHLCIQLDHDDHYDGKIRSLIEAVAFFRFRGVDGRALSARAREMGAQGAMSRCMWIGSLLLGFPPPPGLSREEIPGKLRGRLWRAVVERGLWHHLNGGGLPAWYLNYACEILTDRPDLLRAVFPLLRPVLSNPRLGGKGFTYPRQERL